MSLTIRQQWDALIVLAHSYKLPAGFTSGPAPFFVGRKHFESMTAATCALLSAFDKAGVKIPDSIKERPSDL